MNDAATDSKVFVIGLFCSLLFQAVASAGDNTASQLGQFTSNVDVGDPAQKGSVAYEPETQSYCISGAGTNMWFDKDEFHFVYKHMKGDFILRTRAQFVGQGSEPHRKLGWMWTRVTDGYCFA